MSALRELEYLADGAMDDWADDAGATFVVCADSECGNCLHTYSPRDVSCPDCGGAMEVV